MEEIFEKIMSFKPTQVFEIPWLAIGTKENPIPQSEWNGGKWLIFVKNDKIDEIWSMIARASWEGKLGYGCKSSTAFSGRDNKVICVYNDDVENESEIFRIREELRKMGITNKIPYKTNEATRQGKYAEKGQKVSKYFM